MKESGKLLPWLVWWLDSTSTDAGTDVGHRNQAIHSGSQLLDRRERTPAPGHAPTFKQGSSTHAKVGTLKRCPRENSAHRGGTFSHSQHPALKMGESPTTGNVNESGLKRAPGGSFLGSKPCQILFGAIPFSTPNLF